MTTTTSQNRDISHLSYPKTHEQARYSLHSAHSEWTVPGSAPWVIVQNSAWDWLESAHQHRLTSD